MAMSDILVLLVVAAAGVGLSQAVVYKVGDAVGWTTMGSPNYTAWAISKTFHKGDTVVFEYNNTYHNVLEVRRENYKACNAASPIATYTSGNDSIKLKRHGHHFFICGKPGHCEAGQKVDIRIPKPTSSAAPSGSPAASPRPATGGKGDVSSPVASPGPSGAATAAPGGLVFALTLLHLAALAGGLLPQ
ncbi:mavicyanin-like [Musa acuminata AAA Group]|uniref:mavicyanin-like n=1 Tax=Musa acuminata AAA Group TaxID=214697 RepID=UPI0031D51EE9